MEKKEIGVIEPISDVVKKSEGTKIIDLGNYTGIDWSGTTSSSIVHHHSIWGISYEPKLNVSTKEWSVMFRQVNRMYRWGNPTYFHLKGYINFGAYLGMFSPKNKSNKFLYECGKIGGRLEYETYLENIERVLYQLKTFKSESTLGPNILTYML